MAILSTSQSRWVLSILVGVMSAVAIASSASTLAGGGSMFSGRPGDIRGIGLMLGVGGLVVILLCRLAYVLLPRPWRLYTDRIEFTLVAMLWICWTSATMSFSAFTIAEGVCNASPSSSRTLNLPTCPLLTFDLALLHLLSTSTLALLLVILSTALSPNYAASLSNMDGKPREEGGLIMWELAVNSPPPSPTISPLRFGDGSGSGYGAIDEITTRTVTPPLSKRSRTFRGEVMVYALLLLVSVGVVTAAVVLMTKGEFVTSTVILAVIGILSAAFASAFLHIHQRDFKLDSDRRSLLRSLEVGFAISLFLLWPLGAISFTLFPSIPNRACDNPASSVLDPDSDTDGAFTSEDSTCILSFTVITLAWVGAWIIFSRLLGIVFPLPAMPLKPDQPVSTGGEGDALLPRAQTVRRPQVGYGRIVAGEAFELGDEDD